MEGDKARERYMECVIAFCVLSMTTLPTCHPIYMELVECLVMTPCVQKGGGLKECLGKVEETKECQKIREAFRLCKQAKVFNILFK